MHFLVKKLKVDIFNHVPTSKTSHYADFYHHFQDGWELFTSPHQLIFEYLFPQQKRVGGNYETPLDRLSNLLLSLFINLKKALTQCSDKAFHRCSRKSCSKKYCKISNKKFMVEFPFKKVSEFQHARQLCWKKKTDSNITAFKEMLQHCFPGNGAAFLKQLFCRTPVNLRLGSSPFSFLILIEFNLQFSDDFRECRI